MIVAHLRPAAFIIPSPAFLPHATFTRTTCRRPRLAPRQPPQICRPGQPFASIESDASSPLSQPEDTPLPRSEIDSSLFALALPSLGALALDPILSLVDTAFIGRLPSSAPLAGVAIASAVLTFTFSVFNFLAVATVPLVARALTNSSSPSAASRTIAVALYLALFLGAVAAFFLFTLAPHLAALLGAPVTALTHAVSYLRFRAVATPFVLASLALTGAYRGLRDTRTPFRIALVANGTNLLLDALLIPTYGAAGAAAATSASQILAALLLLRTLITHNHLILPSPLPRSSELSPLLHAGAALSVRTFSIQATLAFATSTASAVGVVPLAAFELTRQLWFLHAMVLDSIANAAQAVVSSFVAQGAFVRARLVSDRALVLGTLFGGLIGLAAVGAGNALPSLFTKAPETSALATRCLRMAALATPINGAVFVMDGVLAAANDFNYIAFAIAIAGITAVATLTVVRNTGGGVVAVWGGLNVLMMARGLVLFGRYFSRWSPIPRLALLRDRPKKSAGEVTR